MNGHQKWSAAFVKIATKLYKNAGKDRPLLPTWSCPGNVPDDRSLSIQKYQSCIVSVDRPVYAFLNRLLFYFETVQFRRASTLIH